VKVGGVPAKVEADGSWSIAVQAPVQVGSFTLPIELVGAAQPTRIDLPLLSEGASAQGGISGSIDLWPDETEGLSLILTGSCVGGKDVVAGDMSALIGQDGRWALELKRFDPGVIAFEVSCRGAAGQRVTLGAGTAKLLGAVAEVSSLWELETPEQVQVRDGKLVLEGSVAVEGAKLTALADGRSRTLQIAGGRFREQMAITDAAGTWDLTEVVLVLVTPQGEERRSVRLEVDRTSPAVNTLKPTAELLADPARGIIRVGVRGASGDRLSARLLADGDEIEAFETERDLSGRQVTMLIGEHDYRLVVVDLASNTVEANATKQEYWPRTQVQVDISGPTPAGKVRVPRLPPGSEETFIEPVSIRLNNLPEDNPASIEEVVVTNTATNFRKVFRGSNLDNVRLEIEVPLQRRGLNRIQVKVQPKNGTLITAEKVIEIAR
jgi:hypothetical protein